MNFEIETHRDKWVEVAKANGWYQEPFFLQVWVKDGEIIDSVAHRGLTKDLVVDYETEEIIK